MGVLYLIFERLSYLALSSIVNPILLNFHLQRGVILCKAVIFHNGFKHVAEHMAFDPGASYTIVSPRIISSAGITFVNTETVETIGVTGSIVLPKITVQQIGIQGANAQNVEILVGDLPKKLGLDGLLGYSFLKNFEIITINYRQKELILEAVA